jgi:hypothetical protein
VYFTVGQKRYKSNDVTMETKACTLLLGKNDIKAMMLPWKPGFIVYYGAKTT